MTTPALEMIGCTNCGGHGTYDEEGRTPDHFTKLKICELCDGTGELRNWEQAETVASLIIDAVNDLEEATLIENVRELCRIVGLELK